MRSCRFAKSILEQQTQVSSLNYGDDPDVTCSVKCRRLVAAAPLTLAKAASITPGGRYRRVVRLRLLRRADSVVTVRDRRVRVSSADNRVHRCSLAA